VGVEAGFDLYPHTENFGWQNWKIGLDDWTGIGLGPHIEDFGSQN